MFPEFQDRLEKMRKRVSRLLVSLEYHKSQTRIGEIEEAMAKPGFWDDPDRSAEMIGELKTKKAVVEPLTEIRKRFEDIETLLEMASEEEDDSVGPEIENELEAAEESLSEVEFLKMLSGPHDRLNAYLSIHAGAGGTEACDWASMLLRLFMRWAERRKYKTEELDLLPGEEAGVKSVTVLVKGEWAYGYLKAEVGVHRLVRISPFDSAKRRHTSFCSVDVVPEFEDDVSVEINEKDLRIDTYRAGGAGGQHVNMTDSAVRITHLPTNVVVQCQNERSQHKNKASAMKVLKARLFQLEEQKRRDQIEAMSGEKGDIAFGSQIRSYTLQPYTLVKDHRTGVEIGDVHSVLDGNIDPFIQAFLTGVRKGDGTQDDD
ncbi:MAG: peptide chain release factor 2 [Planctomycetota bacterium]